MLLVPGFVGTVVFDRFCLWVGFVWTGLFWAGFCCWYLVLLGRVVLGVRQAEGVEAEESPPGPPEDEQTTGVMLESHLLKRARIEVARIINLHRDRLHLQ